MGFFWLWIGGVCAFVLVAGAMDTVARKTPWREFALTAAIVTATFAGFGGVVHLAVSWLMQNPWGWLLLLGFIFVGLCVSFVVGVTGLIARALYRG